MIVLCLGVLALIGTSYAAEKQIEITLNKAVVIDHIGYSKANFGKTYLLLPLTFNNKGYDKFEINPDNCKVVINKIQYSRTHISSMAEAGYFPLSKASLMKGTQFGGYAPFEIPEGELDFFFNYETNAWDDYNIVYVLGNDWRSLANFDWSHSHKSAYKVMDDPKGILIQES